LFGGNPSKIVKSMLFDDLFYLFSCGVGFLH
jgi:hypothetical protein